MKTTALVIGIVVVLGLIIGAYFIGARHAVAPTTSSTGTTTALTSSSKNYYEDVSTWQTVREDQAGFALKYPMSFDLNENNSMTPSTDWRLNTQNPGVKVLTITIPSAFDPQTNFVEARLTIGYSKNDTAIADCMTPDPSGLPAATSTVTINGIQFTKFQSNDAGAGQRYDTTSYRTLHAGACYAVEYTLHSAAIENYPESYHLHQFDSAMISGVLDRIIGTFNFL